MTDLIARLEQAKGPDHDLDEAIALACGWRHEVVVWEEGKDDCWYTPDGKTTGGYCFFFTSSIDAACTLMPANSAWAVSHGDPDPSGYPKPYRATVMPPFTERAMRDATEWHDVPAIALCIAALKARALH